MKSTINTIKLKPAMFWDERKNGSVKCRLCPFNCKLSENKVGICRGKQNIDGKLWAINYGLTTSLNVDPIEKKPLYHFYPGTDILSIGPNGCNLKCNFCQNYQVSLIEYPTRAMTPEQCVEVAKTSGILGIAYTYSEPMIWYEHVIDTAVGIHEVGMKNVIVSNGLINPKPLEKLLPNIDAFNIDIKSMDPAFYKKICKGMLNPVLETVKMVANSAHVEITNLIIPGLNDSDELFESLAVFVAKINPLISLHLSCYHPDYKLDIPHTQTDTMLRAAYIAKKSLKHVYLGNIAAGEFGHTYCPNCGEVVIERSGYMILNSKLNGGACTHCGTSTGVIT